jgi:hypothetical protein
MEEIHEDCFTNLSMVCLDSLESSFSSNSVVCSVTEQWLLIVSFVSKADCLNLNVFQPHFKHDDLFSS